MDVDDDTFPEYSGSHCRFRVHGSHGPLTGHFILRNRKVLGDDSEQFGMTDEERIEVIRYHEARHVFQLLSGEDADFLTEAEVKACGGLPECLPFVTDVRKLEPREVITVAARHFLQHFRNELDAYGSADWPIIEARAAGSADERERNRTIVMAMMLPYLVTNTCGIFLDPAGCAWRDFVAEVTPRLRQLTAGTFLEAKGNGAGVGSPADYLASINVGQGRVTNAGLPLQAFGQLASCLPRRGQTAFYGPWMFSECRKNSGPDATLTDFDVSEGDMHNHVMRARSLPGRLRYRITTRWRGNTPGEFTFRIVGRSPLGAPFVKHHHFTVEGRNKLTIYEVDNHTLFSEYGRYHLQIEVGSDSKPVAETHFSIHPRRSKRKRARR